MIREANIPGQEAQALASLIALAMTWMTPLFAVLAAWAIALAATVGGPLAPWSTEAREGVGAAGASMGPAVSGSDAASQERRIYARCMRAGFGAALERSSDCA